jgi:hypothetical protein
MRADLITGQATRVSMGEALARAVAVLKAKPLQQPRVKLPREKLPSLPPGE